MDLLLRITNKEQHQNQLNELYTQTDEFGFKSFPFLVLDEDENAQFKFAAIPEDSKGNQAYQTVRVPNADFVSNLNHCIVAAELVNGKYVWESNGQKTAYESHRGPFSWTEVDPETGLEFTVTKPYVMGVFL